MGEVPINPSVADFVDWDKVDGLRDTSLSSHPEVVVPAYGLDIHPVHLESGMLQKDPVIVELNGPVKKVADSIMPEFIPVLGLAFFEPAFVVFPCGDFHL